MGAGSSSAPQVPREPMEEGAAEEFSMKAKCTAEFVGTFMLIFSVGCNILSGAPSAWVGVSIACTLMVAIYALGGISGGNFNPAVSVALGLAKAMKWQQVGIYCAVQVAAGICASLCYSILFMNTFTLAPSKGFGFMSAGLCELFYTFLLVFVVLNTAAANGTKGNQYYALAIGFSVVAGAYGAGAVSGGCFNPAVAIGIDVVSVFKGFGWCIPYAIFELVGAALAAVLFMVVRPAQFPEVANKMGESSKAVAELTSEFLGTFMLVLTVGLAVRAGSPTAVFAIASSLMVMIYALGDVSGAHFNPAVTTAVFCTKRVADLDAMKTLKYMLAQILGGIFASFIATGIYSGKTFGLGPTAGHNWLQIGVGEWIFTFLLAFVVLCTAVAPPTQSKDMFGLAIGSCVTVGGYAIGATGGGSLNPAVSIGIAGANLLGGGLFWKGIVYSAFELAGGATAAGVLMLTHGSDAAAKGEP